MLTPRGPLPQGVYWRRRMVFAALLVLAVVTAGVLLFGGGDSGDGGTQDAGSGANSATADPTSRARTSAAPPTASPATTATAATATTAAPATPTAASPTASPSAPIGPCTISALTIAAATDAASYPVGASPALRIVITNPGPPCTADLSDPQIELFVYFGDARIWGSHDCNIEPGTAVQTLPTGQAVTREIVWTGLSSVPGCTATRQRVAAGTYTLRPTLSGVAGAPATFAFR